jgi:uncharacterized membrane protein
MLLRELFNFSILFAQIKNVLARSKLNLAIKIFMVINIIRAIFFYYFERVLKTTLCISYNN